MEPTILENKINYLERIKLTETVLKNHKEFIKNNILILQTRQRFKTERHNHFTAEINKIALTSNDGKKWEGKRRDWM